MLENVLPTDVKGRVNIHISFISVTFFIIFIEQKLLIVVLHTDMVVATFGVTLSMIIEPI